jgi:hypothetical protein
VQAVLKSAEEKVFAVFWGIVYVVVLVVGVTVTLPLPDAEEPFSFETVQVNTP